MCDHALEHLETRNFDCPWGTEATTRSREALGAPHV